MRFKLGFTRGEHGCVGPGRERGRVQLGLVQLGLVGMLIVVGVMVAVVNRKERLRPEPWPMPVAYIPETMEEPLVASVRELVRIANRYWTGRYGELLGIYEDGMKEYREPALTFFSGEVLGACGRSGPSCGPFYCGEESRFYMDLAFLRSVGTISDGRGAAAERYLVSHGIAHHLQRLLGITEGVERQRERVPRAEWERLVLREELQAEFLAGSLLAAFDREMGPVELGGGWEFVVEEVRDEVARQGDRSYRERFHVGDLAQRVRWLARGLLSQDLGAESPFEVPFESL